MTDWWILSEVIFPFVDGGVWAIMKQCCRFIQLLGNNSPLLFRREPLTPDNVL